MVKMLKENRSFKVNPFLSWNISETVKKISKIITTSTLKALKQRASCMYSLNVEACFILCLFQAIGSTTSVNMNKG